MKNWVMVAALAAACGKAPPPGDMTRNTETEMPKEGPRLAAGITISEVALFQAVKVTLARDGALFSMREAPIVAGREAVLRIYVEPEAGFAARDLVAKLKIGDKTLEQTKRVSAASSDQVAGSAFDVKLAADLVTPESSYSIEIIDAAGEPFDGDTHPARHPRGGGLEPLGALKTGSIKVTLVPFRYDFDGSKRLPDTSAAQLERYRRALYEAYPVTAVELTVRAAVPYAADFNIEEFDAINDLLVDIRKQDGASFEEYYYGLINPASSFSKFCQGGCTTGQTFIVDDVRDAGIRVGAGHGFSGDDAAGTFVHEMGHAHGRLHAPCDVSRYDANYPDPDGRTAGWGYSVIRDKWFDPDHADFMSYCDPAWVSAYTYSALHERVLAIDAGPQGGKRTLFHIGNTDVPLTHAPIRAH
jgi:hypothetical protein